MDSKQQKEDLADLVQQETSVVELAKNGDEDAILYLEKELINLYKTCVFKYINGNIKHMQDDLIEDFRYLLYAAITEYDESSPMKFSTFFFQKTRWNFINLYNGKMSKMTSNNPVYIEKMLGAYDDNRAEKIDAIKAVIVESENISKEAKIILDIRHNSSYNKSERTWKEISKQVGLSPSACVKLYNKTITTLRRKLT
jgi:DNA-directed RNA polymerase specialized sigma subunit